MGEPLPREVSAEWRRWCNLTGYIEVDLDTKIKDHHYRDLTLNTLWVHASDDEIANLKSVKDMIRVFEKIESKIMTINPEEYGFKDIGHVKFFSSKKRILWKFATDWLNEQSSV